MLNSARFKGDPILQRIRDADTTADLRFGAQGDSVRAAQFALIELGYSIPTERGQLDNEGTLPFADRNE
jgi:hypothetical protein